MSRWWKRWRQIRPRAVTDTVAVTVNTPLDLDPLNNDRGRNKTITHVDDLPIVDGGSAVDLGDFTVELNGQTLTITPDTDYTGAIRFTYTFTSGSHQKLGEVVGEVS